MKIIVVKTNSRPEIQKTIGAFTNKYEAIKYLWNLNVKEYYKKSWERHISPYQWWYKIRKEWWKSTPYIFEEIEIIK